MSVSTQIVTVNATVTEVPQPSDLQQTGALISLGGTTQDGDTLQYYGNAATLIAALSDEGNYEEVEDMANSFFAQGNQVGVSVLELGVQETPTNAVAALAAWLTANPNTLYATLLPANWDTVGSTVNTLAGQYANPTSKFYLFPMTSTSTMSAYTNKSILFTVPSPTAASSEFQAAGPFYDWLSNAPTAAAPAAPMAFRYQFGLTPWVEENNQTAIQNILNAYGNIVRTGAEGGISNAVLNYGTTTDGEAAMWWYAVDWVQIQAKLQLAAAIIAASNNGTPIYYNQQGINTLLAILEGIGTTGAANGLLLSATFSAQSFASYTAQNPSDYNARIYKGFSATITPQNSFQSITVNIDATQFA